VRLSKEKRLVYTGDLPEVVVSTEIANFMERALSYLMNFPKRDQKISYLLWKWLSIFHLPKDFL
jgi:hypothetical protein